MAVTSGFFNSVDGDRKYNAEQMSSYFDGLVSDGVFENVGQALRVTANTGMTISVGTGRALIDCHWLKNDAVLNITLDPASIQNTRYDYIVVKLDTSVAVRSMTIEVISDSIPSATAEVQYLILARVVVRANTTSITQSSIQDYRGTRDCPYVTGLIQQVNTSTLFSQWQAAFEELYEAKQKEYEDWLSAKKTDYDSWYSTLTQDLTVDTRVVKYQHTVIAGTGGSTYLIPISQYDRDKDILFVLHEHTPLIEAVDYTVEASSNVTYPSQVRWITYKGDNDIVGKRLTFIVLKSQLGSSSAADDSALIEALSKVVEVEDSGNTQ